LAHDIHNLLILNGGESGIRTQAYSAESVSCIILVTKVPNFAMLARAAWPISLHDSRAHGAVEAWGFGTLDILSSIIFAAMLAPARFERISNFSPPQHRDQFPDTTQLEGSRRFPLPVASEQHGSGAPYATPYASATPQLHRKGTIRRRGHHRSAERRCVSRARHRGSGSLGNPAFYSLNLASYWIARLS